MCASKGRPTKVFTLEEATKMLPLVRAIVGDLVRCSREVIERRERLNHLLAGRDLQAGDLYEDELAQVEQDVQRQTEKLREYIEELEQLGVEPKGPEGLVDFPAMIDGRPVYLCWKYDEPDILFWHELDAGFAGRQPLMADSVSSATDPQGDEQPDA